MAEVVCCNINAKISLFCNEGSFVEIRHPCSLIKYDKINIETAQSPIVLYLESRASKPALLVHNDNEDKKATIKNVRIT